MNIDYCLIGSRIKKMRKAQNMTQETLAEKLDVSIGYISQVERGITKISLDLLGAISSILRCDVSDFIKESALHSKDYLLDEIGTELRLMDDKGRKTVLKIIKVFNDEL